MREYRTTTHKVSAGRAHDKLVNCPVFDHLRNVTLGGKIKTISISRHRKMVVWPLCAAHCVVLVLSLPAAGQRVPGRQGGE